MLHQLSQILSDLLLDLQVQRMHKICQRRSGRSRSNNSSKCIGWGLATTLVVVNQNSHGRQSWKCDDLVRCRRWTPSWELFWYFLREASQVKHLLYFGKFVLQLGLLDDLFQRDPKNEGRAWKSHPRDHLFLVGVVVLLMAVVVIFVSNGLDAENVHEVVDDSLLLGQVILELKVILNDFVPPPLDVVQEGTRCWGWWQSWWLTAAVSLQAVAWGLRILMAVPLRL